MAAPTGWCNLLKYLLFSFRLEWVFFVFSLSVLAVFARIPATAAEMEDSMTGEGVIAFDIPALPLSGALELFMAATNIVVVVDSEMTAMRTSSAVRGRFSPEAALRFLLAGTEVEPQLLGEGAYMLVPVASFPNNRRSVPSYSDYAATIQQSVTRALCRNTQTHPDRFRIVMRLWIDPAGTVSQSELATSTGNGKLDHAIEGVLRGLDMGAPVPIGLPQPVKLAIIPHKGGGSVCPPESIGGQHGSSSVFGGSSRGRP